MNNITLAHIGAELLVMGGLAFHFHRKTNQLQQQITDLQAQNKDMMAAMEQLHKRLNQGGGTSVMQRPLRRSARSEILQPVRETSLRQRKRCPVREEQESGDETLDDGDLDQELESEYKEIQRERCSGDSCLMD